VSPAGRSADAEVRGDGEGEEHGGGGGGSEEGRQGPRGRPGHAQHRAAVQPGRPPRTDTVDPRGLKHTVTRPGPGSLFIRGVGIMAALKHRDVIYSPTYC